MNKTLLILFFLTIFNNLFTFLDIENGRPYYYCLLLSWLIPLFMLYFLKKVNGNKMLKRLIFIINIVHLAILILFLIVLVQIITSA
ncbi:hypothetical protein CEY16_12475 [Halalkalibacillus sediminis]|uniref:Uncharacterized protein n=1 Tax=Halalkalibacillus sediminis TaxID=2018042 RepID=A0A2I0QQM9_9BACI|nr:hypothetical protein CEY16_12475 [Halalkalibacillus sediminis]